MTAVNEWVVREYFESLGYFVLQGSKYVVQGKRKEASEELDLVVCHPRVKEHSVSRDILWTSADLRTVAKAAVSVVGWHTDRFYAKTFDQMPDILRFAADDCVKVASEMLGGGPVARILCLPKLPAGEGLRKKAVERLRAAGVDGVLTFRIMLLELVQQVDVNRNYEKSIVLQMLRILKNYGLLADPQLELFTGRRRRRKKA